MRVFISSAWENDEYRALVKSLAARLRQDGIDARLDAWHLEEGLSIPDFMEREVRHADKILIVCSPQYRQKVYAMQDAERSTGTGWELMLMTSSIWADVSNRNKITPVLLLGTWQEAAPSFLSARPYFDLANMATFETNYRELLRSLTGQNEPVPPLGRVPEIAPERAQPLRGPQSEADAGAFQIASGTENREHSFLRALPINSNLNIYDRAWTYVGPPLAAGCLSFAWYARSGGLPVISPPSPGGDDSRIVASYWGLLIASSSLLALGLIADRYMKYRSAERPNEPPWPRMALIEEGGRDSLISSVAFGAIVGLPLVTWILCAIRYSESRITPWDGKTTAEALAQGFWSSRWKAPNLAPFGHPQFHVHPPDGFQYIPWLTDPLLAVFDDRRDCCLV